MTLPPRDELLELLRADLRSLGIRLPDALPSDEDMRALGIDSLALAEFVARVEQRFRRAIPDEIWAEMRTLDQIARWLEEHVR